MFIFSTWKLQKIMLRYTTLLLSLFLIKIESNINEIIRNIIKMCLELHVIFFSILCTQGNARSLSIIFSSTGFKGCLGVLRLTLGGKLLLSTLNILNRVILKSSMKINFTGESRCCLGQTT